MKRFLEIAAKGSRLVLRRRLLGALALAWAFGAPGAAQAVDCSQIAHLPQNLCTDVARLPRSSYSDIAAVLKRARRFFRSQTTAYIVSSAEQAATLPYMLPRQKPYVLTHQIHIPEIYYGRTEKVHEGKRHYIWHYILGHEMAHVYQEETGLIAPMIEPFKNNSVVLAELHADYMAGFFMAREFKIDALAIDNLFKELKELPAGIRGSSGYHGEPAQRYFVATQGLLAAISHPNRGLREAGSGGINCAFRVYTEWKTTKNLGELCQ